MRLSFSTTCGGVTKKVFEPTFLAIECTINDDNKNIENSLFSQQDQRDKWDVFFPITTT